MAIPSNARLFAVIPAAGTGTRMGAALPKQYLTVRGATIAEHTVRRLLSLARLERIAVSVSASDPWWPQLPVARHRRLMTTDGGETRAHSVLNGLQALLEQGGASPTDWVLVHDMARPCVRLSDIDRLLSETGPDGAILAQPVSDTIKQSDSEGHIQSTLDRQQIWRALTPQLFELGKLRDALKNGIEKGFLVTDEASAMEFAGVSPLLVEGKADNIKVTVPEDLPLASWLLSRQEDEGLLWQLI